MKKAIIITSSIIILLAIALSLHLLNGCQKIENIPENKIQNAMVSLCFIEGNTNSYLDGVNVTITDNENYCENMIVDSILNIELDPGIYQISAEKTGFLMNSETLEVPKKDCESCGMICTKQCELFRYLIDEEIGPNGGILKWENNKNFISLKIPPGALVDNERISFSEITNLSDPLIYNGTQYPRIFATSNHIQFRKPVELEISMNLENVDSVYLVDNPAAPIEKILGVIDPANHLCRFKLNHFSTWQVMTVGNIMYRYKIDDKGKKEITRTICIPNPGSVNYNVKPTVITYKGIFKKSFIGKSGTITCKPTSTDPKKGVQIIVYATNVHVILEEETKNKKKPWKTLIDTSFVSGDKVTKDCNICDLPNYGGGQ